ncbi:MAG TPA: membrane dipeptidase [Membranihabitans sp.]|nr:membrane dipeptidase [Membranihabitans sp.]
MTNSNNQKPWIFDAHLDLAMNAIDWNRDLRQSVQSIRKRETGMTDHLDRGKGVVSLPALREGRIGVVVATQIARYVAEGSTLPGWNSPPQAWAQTQGQLAWYRAMEAEGEMVQITNFRELEDHILLWENQDTPDQEKPVGYILSLEGADSIVTLDLLERSYEDGLRALGPAHYGPGRYADGTGMSGPLHESGKKLIRRMDELGMILDVTHFTDEGFDEALELFHGPVWASHHNSRVLVPHQRQLTDDQIKRLIERGSVIGASLDVWMMVSGWVRGSSDPVRDGAPLQRILDHWDHICQIAGNTDHIAIGSDLDGAFGKEQCPHDLETIADLQKFPELLLGRGYSTVDIEKIMHGNWVRFLKKAWK